MASTVLTGAGGYIGRHVAALLSTDGRSLVAIPHRWGNRDELERLLGDAPVDRCIHLGWHASEPDYRVAEEPNLASLAASVDLTRVLLERGCRHLVAAGTSVEYGATREPVDESAPIAPFSVYAAAKTAFRVLLESSWVRGRMGVAWARIFNVAGAGEHRERILPQVTLSLLRGQPIALSDGGQVRDFLSVSDVSAALVTLSVTASEGVFNVSSGTGIALRDVFDTLAGRLHADRSLLRFGARPRAQDEAPLMVGVNARLSSTGWRAADDLEAMLDSVIAWWRSQSTSAPRSTNLDPA